MKIRKGQKLIYIFYYNQSCAVEKLEKVQILNKNNFSLF